MKMTFRSLGWRIIITILVFFLIIFLTWIYFTLDGPIITGTNLTKSDWLTFWGSFLGFCGTIFLGFIALWQNHKLFEVNKQLIELGTTAQFYSEIEPIYLEIEKRKTDTFLAQIIKMEGIAQWLVRSKNSNEEEIKGLQHIRLLFKKNRPFAPNSYNIESCQIYLDNENGESQKSVVGYCTSEDKDKFFTLANTTEDNIKGSVIMSAFFICKEDDDKTWTEFTEAEKLRMSVGFKYKNPFGIETKSSINILWSNPKNKTIYKRFKATDYYIFKNKHSLRQEKE